MKQLTVFLVLVACYFTFNAQASNKQVADFFQRKSIGAIELSPNGELVAYEKYGEVFIGGRTIPFVDIYGVNEGYFISRLIWISNDTLAFKTSNKNTNEGSYWFVKVSTAGNQIQIAEHELIDNQGYIVDRLEHEPDTILFGVFKRGDEGVYSDVHKIRLFTGKTYRFQKRNKFNKNSGKILTWITDQDSHIRAGISYEDRKPTLWVRSHSRSLNMEEIWTGNRNTHFSVYGVSRDKTKLWAITDFESDVRIAIEFDLESGGQTSIIYQHPERDVSGILMDIDGNKPLAISYYEEGMLNYHFLNATSEEVVNTIQTQYQDYHNRVFDITSDSTAMLVAQRNQTEPGRLMHCNDFGRSCVEIASLYPELQGIQLSTTEAFYTERENDITIESFISIPSNVDQATIASTPLIIMPHGGPIGISDKRYFNADIEWLTHNGFAVLRVNYRGSGGFGKEFKLSGLREWGRGIEGDITAALDNALSRYKFLDEQRMCMFGGSYGGYSALMGVIQSPQRFKCAISFAGVTDISLLFNRSSVIGNDNLTKALKLIVGDPNQHMAELMQFSPVYNAQKIATPVLLVHGTRDNIVDVEHTWRLSRVLTLHGIDHERHIVDGLGHSLSDPDYAKQVYGWIMPFLQEHLH